MNLITKRLMAVFIPIVLGILFLLITKGFGGGTHEIISGTIGGVLIGGILAIPTYVLVNIAHYDKILNMSTFTKDQINELFAKSHRWCMSKNINPQEFQLIIEKIIKDSKSMKVSNADLIRFSTAMACLRYKTLYRGDYECSGYPEIVSRVQENKLLIKVIEQARR